MAKTQILVQAINAFKLSQNDISRERFYTSATLNDWVALFFERDIITVNMRCISKGSKNVFVLLPGYMLGVLVRLDSIGA